MLIFSKCLVFKQKNPLDGFHPAGDNFALLLQPVNQNGPKANLGACGTA
jgi:hypothetical protein